MVFKYIKNYFFTLKEKSLFFEAKHQYVFICCSFFSLAQFFRPCYLIFEQINKRFLYE